MGIPAFPHPTRIRRRIGLPAAAGVILAVVASALVPFTPLTTVVPIAAAEAANPAAFNPGNLITDATFYNPDEMSVAQIQAFLNEKRPTCTAGYTCLPGYSESTYTRAADVYCTNAYTGVASQSAASIIKSVAVACGINPRVLLVLLQKEQGLVTSAAPTAAKYQRATGYACPDSGTCAVSTLGFYNQVYKAAWQFKVYRYNPPRWRHQPGQVNNIYLHPNTAACGTKAVFIENQATAGLYNYTPYTPNDAAIININSTGDACSSYGNRNFWRYYTDWFGNPTGSGDLLRNSTDGAVYLVTDSQKYLISAPGLLTTFGALGAVQSAGASFISAIPSATTAASNLAVSTSGQLFLVGNGTKHAVASCDIALRYGFPAPCGAPMALTDFQLAKFATGAPLDQFTRSFETGITYQVAGGVKRAFQSVDLIAAVANGQSTSAAVAPQAVLDGIPVGPDYYFTASDVRVEGSTQRYMSLSDGSLLPVPTADTALAFGLRATRTTSAAALAASVVSARQLSIAVTCAATTYIAGGGQLWAVPSNGGLSTTVLDAATCAALPKSAQSVTGAVFLQGPNSGNIYAIAGGTKRIMTSWAMLDALNGSNPRVLIPAALSTITAIPDKSDWPGALVSDSAGNLFLINGTSQKIPVPASLASAFSSTGSSPITDATSAAYALAPTALTLAVTCATTTYIAGGGSLWATPTAGGLPTTALDPTTCTALPKSTQAVTGALFLQGPNNGNIYYINNGIKRIMTSWAMVDSLNNGKPRVTVPASTATLAAIPDTIFGSGALAKDAAGSLYLIDGTTQKFPITAALAAEFGLGTAIPITDATSAAYAIAPTALSIAVTCGGVTYIAGGSLWAVPSAAGLPTTALDPTTCAALPKSTQAVTGALFLQGPNNGNIYYINNGIKRIMTSWAMVDSLNNGKPRVTIPASTATLAAIPDTIFGPGSLAKDTSGSLYIINGASQKFSVTAAFAAEFGLQTAIPITDATSAAYAIAPTALSIAVTCGGVTYIAGGSLWAVPSAAGLPTTALDPTTCAALPKSGQTVTGSVFLQGPNSGNVYYINNGTKRIMTSWALVDSLNNGKPRIIIPASAATLSAIPDF